MAVLEQTFRAGCETIHAVLLRQTSKLRWNAFLWGSSLRFANSFARRENAEKWLADLLQRYFPSAELDLETAEASSGPAGSARQPGLVREALYRGSES